jgi:prenyltransferase beta subunit
MKQTISQKLFNALLKGKERLGKQALDRIVGFIESQQTKEASFVDKSGKADLYYTVFGWTLSRLLDIPIDTKKATQYLSAQDTEALDLIHYAAYVRCRMILLLMEKGAAGWFFHALRRRPKEDLRSYTGWPHNDPLSPYTQFIRFCLSEDSGQMIRHKKEMITSLSRYRAPTGGYMNTTDGQTGTANATVAALAVTGQIAGYRDNADIRYLQSLQRPSGGFCAAEATPVPDLLSTATALFMLNCYGLPPRYDANEFIEAHWLDSGGFSATLLEDKSDVEYTYYGLLALCTHKRKTDRK